MSSSTPSHHTETLSDRKAARDLAEARQAGSMPAAVDVKTGQLINPHNPDFITKRPWYLGGEGGAEAGPSLDHQNQTAAEEELTLLEAERVLEAQRQKERQQAREGVFTKGQWVEAYKRGKPPYKICQIIKIHKAGREFDLQFEDGTIERKVKLNPQASKPRIRMTKTGSRAIAAGAKETFDSKRDQYHGYDKDTHNAKLTQKFEEREAMRRQLREQAKEQAGDDDQAKNDSDFDDSDIDDDGSEDEFVQRDEDAKVLTTRLARQGGVGGAQMKVTARNLRIREDTAKYLRNLDPNSAYYDPKSRSMRDNPNPEVAPDAADFAGDNFARISGDAVALADTQLFAWDAAAKGVAELHPQANPSQAELLKKEFKDKASELKMQRKKAVLDKYGGQEYLDGSGGLASAVEDQKKPAADRKLRFGVSTATEEYSRDGRLIKSAGKEVKQQPIESKYEEDVFINGHTTVWGSYFHIGAFRSGLSPWGYADDHSLMKMSYCTGENGRIANDEANEMRFGTGKAGSAALAQARGMLKAAPGSAKSGAAAASHLNRSKLYGEAEQNADIDQEKLKEALKRAKQEKRDAEDKKRKYHSMNADVNMTEEDMEAYRLTKEQRNDPMAKISSDDVLDYRK